jgi:hypothetical protein
MEKKHRFTLVDGKFEIPHASTVLLNLISSKLNYHNMERFGIKERNDGDTSHHDKRIKELKEAATYVKTILKEAEKSGKKIKLEGDVKIQLVK